MKGNLALAVLLLVSNLTIVSAQVESWARPPASKPPAPASEERQERIRAAFDRLPLHFEANQGQAGSDVKFLARGAGGSVLVGRNEAVLAGNGTPAVRMKFVGANPRSAVEGLEKLPGKVNYFLGSDPKQWRRGVETYGKVRWRQVYPGIDVVWYGRGGQVEYDVVVAPGAKPGRVRMRFEGAEKLEVAPAGDLVIHTAGGALRQRSPLVYQGRGGERKQIAGRYVVQGRNEVGFEVGAYDTERELVLDPTRRHSASPRRRHRGRR